MLNLFKKYPKWSIYSIGFVMILLGTYLKTHDLSLTMIFSGMALVLTIVILRISEME